MEFFSIFRLPVLLLGQAMGAPCSTIPAMGATITLPPVTAPAEQKSKPAVFALNFQ